MFTNVNNGCKDTFSPMVKPTAHAQWNLKQTEHVQWTWKGGLVAISEYKFFEETPNGSYRPNSWLFQLKRYLFSLNIPSLRIPVLGSCYNARPYKIPVPVNINKYIFTHLLIYIAYKPFKFTNKEKRTSFIWRLKNSWHVFHFSHHLLHYPWYWVRIA